MLSKKYKKAMKNRRKKESRVIKCESEEGVYINDIISPAGGDKQKSQEEYFNSISMI